MTTADREARLTQTGAPSAETPYVRLLNPITPERNVMRRSLLSSVMEITEHNFRLSERLALFEIGQVFLPRPGQELPDEPAKLAVVLTGLRQLSAWIPTRPLSSISTTSRVSSRRYWMSCTSGGALRASGPPLLHPGKSAWLKSGETVLGFSASCTRCVERRLDLAPNRCWRLRSISSCSCH